MLSTGGVSDIYASIRDALEDVLEPELKFSEHKQKVPGAPTPTDALDEFVLQGNEVIFSKRDEHSIVLKALEAWVGSSLRGVVLDAFSGK